LRVLQIANGHLLPRCLHVVAELGIADHLGDAPMTAEALATAAGLNADALHRVLRMLAVAGIFEPHGDSWAHTDLSRTIRSDHPRSMRPYIRMVGGRRYWFAVGELPHALSTGRPVAEKFVPGGTWAYFRDHPETARAFDAAMEARASEEIAALLAAFDFTPYRVIADIGGGRGQILRAVLAAAPGTNGILFDLPGVVAGIAPQPRLSVHGGDFLTDPLPAADAYIVGHVLHNWPDEEAAAILRSIRRAAAPDAELLVLESILPDAPEPHPAFVSDLVQLTFTGGRERTRDEYERLLAAGGFRLQRIVATSSPTSVIVGATM